MKTLSTIGKTIRIEEIKKLHEKIGAYLRNTLDIAIQIGELLKKQKSEIGHGAWLPWVKKNMPFSERVAQDYMRFWDRRDEIKSARLADLAGARKLLAAPKAPAKRASGKTTSTTRKSKKKAAAKAASSDVQRLSSLFGELYADATGEKPYIGGAQYGIFKNLLKQQPVEDIEARLHLYFAGDFWFTNSGFSLKGFMAHYNEIVEPRRYNRSGGRREIESDADYCAAYATLFRLIQRAEANQEIRDVVAIHEAMRDYKRYRKANWEPPVARSRDGSPVELGDLKYCELGFEESLYVFSYSSWLEDALFVNQSSFDVVEELRRGGEWSERLFAWVREQDAFAGMVKDLWGQEESPGVVKTMVENRIVTNAQAEAFTIETFLAAWDDLQDQWREESEAWEAERAKKAKTEEKRKRAIQPRITSEDEYRAADERAFALWRKIKTPMEELAAISGSLKAFYVKRMKEVPCDIPTEGSTDFRASWEAYKSQKKLEESSLLNLMCRGWAEQWAQLNDALEPMAWFYHKGRKLSRESTVNPETAIVEAAS